MNVFFGITESFGGGGGGRGDMGLGLQGGLGGGRDRDIRGNQNTNGGSFFIPRLSMLQDDN